MVKQSSQNLTPHIHQRRRLFRWNRANNPLKHIHIHKRTHVVSADNAQRAIFCRLESVVLFSLVLAFASITVIRYRGVVKILHLAYLRFFSVNGKWVEMGRLK